MKLSAYSKQAGIATPLLIGGVVIIGVIVFLLASGTLKLSGNVSKNSDQPQESVQAPQPTAVPKVQVILNPEPFTDAKLGLSINYPEGWKVNSAVDNVTIYKPSDTTGSGKADAMIAVFSAPIGEFKDTKLATIADLHKVQLKKLFSDVTIIKEGETEIGGQSAYEMEFTGVMGGENMHGEYIVLTSPTKLYAVLGGANAGMWNDLKDTINASIQTFKKQ